MTEALYQPFPMRDSARAQIWRHQPATRRPRHFHAEPELNLVTAGRGKFGIGEAVVVVGAGDLLGWAPGQDHVLLEASADFDLFVIGLTPALSDRVLANSRASALSGPTRIRMESATLARFRTLADVRTERLEISVVERHVGDFWREAHALRASAQDKHAVARRALMSLLDHPDRGRDEVAQLARSSPSEVSRHFHRNMGLTLRAYRTRLRLLRFIEMADGGADNLLSAALAAGFGSYSQCHRAFQKTVGYSPRVFFGSAVRREIENLFSPESQVERKRLPEQAAMQAHGPHRGRASDVRGQLP